jgi:hypothetical protein
MAYFLDLFSPETFERISQTQLTINGFRIRQEHAASRVHPGDKLICYLTKVSRWVGILEVLSDYYIDETPRYFDENDPFVVRFTVKPIVWLPVDRGIPIKEDHVWKNLSFTKDHPKHSSSWTGKFRSSLSPLDEADGQFLENILMEQSRSIKDYPINTAEYHKYLKPKIRRPGGEVSVSIPEDADFEPSEYIDKQGIRESIRIQSLLAQIGEKMGFSIWLPNNDRSRVLREWKPAEGVLLDVLPLNYDQVTLKTIEQIDVLWLKRRSIVRAFEVEHTTSVYSGILRMADLLALQPNMDIKLHIVAPASRREKVFQELQRPVFTLLEKGPLSENGTFISYDSLMELAEEKHLTHLSDSVIRDYEEEVD